MNRKLLAAAALCVSSAVFYSNDASASFINAPVPTNAYITLNGLDWAWASPLEADGGPLFPPNSQIDLSYESQFGWRLPTADELLNAPLATQFEFAGANVPLGGTDPISGANFVCVTDTLTGAAALAVPYFSNTHHEGDWSNAPGSGGGACPLAPWWGQPGAAYYSESLVVRNDQQSNSVPEPVTLPVAAAGLVGAIAIRRRKKSRV
jgi:hypothetical protein